ncbi:hypothetical protein ACFWAY_26195 [Rhodococcus sp. NPDC059968]|uniref:hypothetical protein n=1 Tax=Rhodococcus sp. NPDC059968 TaxID=3347017 RepID=UPI00366EFEC3
MDPHRPGHIASYLSQRGLIAADIASTVEVLAGGVSSDVFAITAGERQLVVKQALPQLKVTDVVFSPRIRGDQITRPAGQWFDCRHISHGEVADELLQALVIDPQPLRHRLHRLPRPSSINPRTFTPAVAR